MTFPRSDKRMARIKLKNSPFDPGTMSAYVEEY
jgi:hypothetical protein